MSYSEYQIGVPPFSGMVRILLFVTVGVYLLQMLPGLGDFLMDWGASSPEKLLKGQVWRLISSGFLHSTKSFSHVLFNMFGLWMFGTAIEARLGRKGFLWFYLLSMCFSGLFAFTYLLWGQSPQVVGASGAVFAIVTLYAVYYPHSQIYIWGIIPVKARIFAIIFAVISFVGTFNNNDNIAHSVHLGGILFGFLYLKYSYKIQMWIEKIAEKKKKKKTIIHIYEPRKSRQEVAAEKAELDGVLKKISESGMESLTEEEYRILERESGKPVKRT